jgi:hypothetical protein
MNYQEKTWECVHRPAMSRAFQPKRKSHSRQNRASSWPRDTLLLACQGQGQFFMCPRTVIAPRNLLRLTESEMVGSMICQKVEILSEGSPPSLCRRYRRHPLPSPNTPPFILPRCKPQPIHQRKSALHPALEIFSCAYRWFESRRVWHIPVSRPRLILRQWRS